MEVRYKNLSEKLETFQYYETLSFESVPLVERMLEDLITTTESLKKYMKIAEKAIEEKNNLEICAKPLHNHNAQLMEEKLVLKTEYKSYMEYNKRIQKELNEQIKALKSSNADYIVETEKLKRRLAENTSLKTARKSGVKVSSSSNLFLSPPQRDTDIMALTGQKSGNLTKQVQKLKDENIKLMNSNEVLQQQVIARDQEIDRLNAVLTKASPEVPPNSRSSFVSKNPPRGCECGNGCDEEVEVTRKLDPNKLLQINCCLKKRLKESLCKEYEMSKKCAQLSERNQLLQNEMMDIDHLALAVESSCNSEVKNKTQQMLRLQERMQTAIYDAQLLREQNHKLEIEINELKAQLCKGKDENNGWQNEKKKLTDEINRMTLIEQGLNQRLDELSAKSQKQYLEICELKHELGRDPFESQDNIEVPTTSKSFSRNRESLIRQSREEKTGKKIGIGNSRRNSVKDSRKKSEENIDNIATTKCTQCPDHCNCADEVKRILLAEMENIRSEKQYYMEQYQKLLQDRNDYKKQGPQDRESGDLYKQLIEKQASIETLMHDKQILSQEKYNLMTRLEAKRDEEEGDSGPCNKNLCRKMQRELGTLKQFCEELEKEKTYSKEKLVTESKNHERTRQKLADVENNIYALESEKRKLSQQSLMRGDLEHECEQLRKQVQKLENELIQCKTLNQQIKTLNENYEIKLRETEKYGEMLESELSKLKGQMQEDNRSFGQDRLQTEKLKKDSEILLRQLTDLEKEKDDILTNLDAKTEKAHELERAVRAKECLCDKLQRANDELKEQLQTTRNETESREYLLRSSKSDMQTLKDELTSIKRLYESTIQENRRLQNDLTSATVDCDSARRDLDIYKRQVEDLKTQLKQYIAEVKRTEDLISHKEIERSELLDQFRSLSQEANMLENSNHTLENEASHTRVQLSVALDHAADLERRLEGQEEIVKSYEKQITDLTNQMATIEIETKQTKFQFERSELEMQTLKDLNARLERENQSIKRDLRFRKDFQTESEMNLEQFRNERETLAQEVDKEKNVSQSLKDLWTKAKEEAAEAKFANKTLQNEMGRLKIEMQELRERVNSTSDELDLYKDKTLDYSRQNRELRRDLASYRSRESESSKYPSL